MAVMLRHQIKSIFCYCLPVFKATKVTLGIKASSLPHKIFFLFCIFIIIGCDKFDKKVSTAPKFSKIPQIVIVNSPVKLAVIVSLEADQPVVATYRVTDGQNRWQAHSRSQATTVKKHYKVAHRDILLRFKPNVSHKIYVRITNANGQVTEFSKPLYFHAPDLPADFPKITVDQLEHFPESDDIALISLLSPQAKPWSTFGQTLGWLIAIDNSASVVWYMPLDAAWHKIEQLETGNLRLHNQAGSALEVDMLGNKIAAWLSPESLDPQHEAAAAYFKQYQLTPTKVIFADNLNPRKVQLLNGHSLALTRSQSGTSAQSIVDEVTEFNAEGKPVQKWHLTDILGYLHQVKGATGLVYQPQSDSIVMSLPDHQAMISMNYTTGNLDWVLSDPARKQILEKNLKPEPNTTILKLNNPSQPYVTKKGNLLVFDRGMESRILLYSVNKKAMSYKQLGVYPVKNAQLPAQIHYINKNLLLAYRQNNPLDSSGQPKGNQAPISVLTRLTLIDLLDESQSSVQQQKQMIMKFEDGLIWDNKLIAHLIPPELDTKHHKKIVGKPAVDNSVTTTDENISQLETIEQIPVTEGDWRIVMETEEGLSEQLLKIDMQQGPIAIGYLEDYPVMLVIKGSSLSFTARTSGELGKAEWGYRGTMDASGMNAEGMLTVKNQQGDILAENVPWQAYRTN